MIERYYLVNIDQLEKETNNLVYKFSGSINVDSLLAKPWKAIDKAIDELTSRPQWDDNLHYWNITKVERL